MKPCEEYEVLVSLRAAGALEPADAARLDAHLERCPACRAEAAAAAEALALAALPPPSEAERRALRDLPASTLDALHRAERRHGLGRRVLAGVAVAAAVVAFVLAPRALREQRPVAPASEMTATWEEPDLDALWDAAELVDLEASATDGGDGAEAAYAALDF